MISIDNKAVVNIAKIVLFIVISYSVLYLSFRAVNYFKTYHEKEKLTNELQLKRDETNSLKTKVNESKKRVEDLEKSYITKEELESRIKEIYSRMSLNDYQLHYIDAKKMCIDRYIIITKVETLSPKGVQAAEGILSYLGEIKKSDKDETLYFVNYIASPKEIK